MVNIEHLVKYRIQFFITGLQLQGMSPAGFEVRLARELMTKQLVAGVAGTASITGEEFDRAYRLLRQQRKFDYVILPVGNSEPEINVSDEELNAYYETHKGRFISPERVRIEYLELKAGDIPVMDEISEEDIAALYNEQSERFVTEEQRRARHILIQIQPEADENTRKEAMERAQKAMERLQSGEEFGALAKELSEDPGSASQGGDLDFFGKGMMTPAFEAVAFSLPENTLSEIVETPFGLHIIEVTEIRPQQVKSIDQVRDDLVEELRGRVRDDLFYDQSEILANQTYEQPDTLEVAADALGLEVSKSDWMTRETGSGIGQYPQVRSSAFSEDVLVIGNNSEPIEIQADHIVVIRIAEHEESSQRPMEEVREEVRKQLRQEKARELVRIQGEELQARLDAGEPIAEVVADAGLELQSSGLVTRNAGVPERAITATAFTLQQPTGQPVTGNVILPSGDYVLISLNEVLDGDVTALSEEERLRAQEELGTVYGTAEMAAMLSALKQKADIVIPDQALQ